MTTEPRTFATVLVIVALWYIPAMKLHERIYETRFDVKGDPLNCPNCGAWSLFVTKSKTQTKEVVYRKCGNGHKFKIETPNQNVIPRKKPPQMSFDTPQAKWRQKP